jgi:hypothetical protein
VVRVGAVPGKTPGNQEEGAVVGHVGERLADQRYQPGRDHYRDHYCQN